MSLVDSICRAAPWLLTASFVCVHVPLQGQQQNVETDVEQVKRWQALYSDIAGRFFLKRLNGEPTLLQLHSEAILNYTNPVRSGQQHGSMYIWLHQGRPEAVGTVWSKTHGDAQRRIAIEFHSLTD
ncbi:MAG: hypothetical protein AAF961_03990, partial [Planctomycetota bacterium]